MVSFVGAGPGAPDLITLRGKARLETADLVIYAGSLVNPVLLDWVKDGCICHDSARMSLEQVIEEMSKADAQGKQVVRLHTGDPCLYGAIREQMDALDAQKIAYESVPGVSSFCAAAAAAQAEYTLPGVSQTVILSRMAGRTPVPPKEEIASLAAHGATMVLFLSAGMLEKLQDALLAGGYAPTTPAAIVYRASWPDEKVVRTTIASLPEAARAQHINRTALILVGNFLGSAYQRSKLYDPHFSHGYRQGSPS